MIRMLTVLTVTNYLLVVTDNILKPICYKQFLITEKLTA